MKKAQIVEFKNSLLSDAAIMQAGAQQNFNNAEQQQDDKARIAGLALKARAARCESLAALSDAELMNLSKLDIDLSKVPEIGVYEQDKAHVIFNAILKKTKIVPLKSGKKGETDANSCVAFEWMKAKGMKSISAATLKRELQHETFRQANGIRSVLVKLGIVEISEKNNANDWTVKIIPESKAAQALCTAYAIELEKPATA